MPLYDIPGRTEPTSVSLSWDGKSMTFPLPYETDDPTEVRLLSKHPGIQEVPAPGPPAEPVSDSTAEWVFESPPEVTDDTVTDLRTSTPRKTSRKEV